MSDVSETLLHMKNGNWLLCRLVANAPDSFLEGEIVRSDIQQIECESPNWG
jgi:hypothetical protein